MNERFLEPLRGAAEERTMSCSAIDFAGSSVFGFESDLERSLACIPLAVRFKLDKCGIKLSLAQWQQLPRGRRQDFLRVRCDTEVEIANFRRALRASIRATSADEPRLLNLGASRPWEDTEVPEQVRRKTLELGAIPPAPYRWRALTPLQRFALIKLSRDGDHARNLMPALREFELL
jgi:hypothetical protein